MRRVVILAEAAEDLEQGRDFYNEQEPGIGDYFADSLVPTSGAWPFITEFISGSLVSTGCSRTDFPSAFTTVKPPRKPRCSQCSTCAVISTGFGRN